MLQHYVSNQEFISSVLRREFFSEKLQTKGLPDRTASPVRTDNPLIGGFLGVVVILVLEYDVDLSLVLGHRDEFDAKLDLDTEFSEVITENPFLLVLSE